MRPPLEHGPRTASEWLLSSLDRLVAAGRSLETTPSSVHDEGRIGSLAPGPPAWSTAPVRRGASVGLGPLSVGLGLLASLLLAVPAAAYAPPPLYVRLTHANSIDHTPVSDWIPLASAPPLNWLGGYEIGYTVEAPGAQRAALQVTAVPDGQATQPLNAPFCTGVAGVAAGAIMPVGVAIQFEGSGVYAVRVGVGPASGGPNDCLAAGPATAASEGSFTVSGPTAPVVVGSPLVFRAKRLPDGAFAGVRAPSPPGGEADTRCARNGSVNPDGSVSGPHVVPESVEDGVVGQIEERAFGRLDVRRARLVSRPGRRAEPRALRHAVVGAAAPRRAQRLPAREGRDLQAELQAAERPLHRGVPRRRRRRDGQAHAAPPRRLQRPQPRPQDCRDVQRPLRRGRSRDGHAAPSARPFVLRGHPVVLGHALHHEERRPQRGAHARHRPAQAVVRLAARLPAVLSRSPPPKT